MASEAIKKAEEEALKAQAEIDAILARAGAKPAVAPPTPRGQVATVVDTRSDEEQEAARVEWFHHYLEVKDWDGAQSMAVSDADLAQIAAAKKRG